VDDNGEDDQRGHRKEGDGRERATVTATAYSEVISDSMP